MFLFKVFSKIENNELLFDRNFKILTDLIFLLNSTLEAMCIFMDLPIHKRAVRAFYIDKQKDLQSSVG